MPRPPAFGWCREHGVHECPLCHPEVAQTRTTPNVTAEDRDRARRALAINERAANSPNCKSHERRIQFASAEAVKKAGVEDEPAFTAPVVEAISANGELIYDPALTARLSARVPGSVFRVFKQVGDPVKAGEVVALVDAAEVGKAKAAFLQALVQARLETANYERVRRLSGGATVTPQEVDKAFAMLSEAKIKVSTSQQALVNLGLPVEAKTFESVSNDDLPDRLRFIGLLKEIADSFDPKTTTGNLLPIVAPLDGVVANRDVVAGEVVDAAKVLFYVVDARRLWLVLDVTQQDARKVGLGQKVRFRPASGKEETAGTISWISTEVNDRTRTVKVRAEFDNLDGRLKANTFGTGRIILREEEKAIVIPNSALQWDGDCHIVFVRDKNFLQPGAPKVFHTRKVRPGAKDDKWTEIIAGVLPGEVVAAKGSSVLRAELMRANLGEG
jgi:cobalt-zinc-cadmium efflux system membrane fusion protein